MCGAYWTWLRQIWQQTPLTDGELDQYLEEVSTRGVGQIIHKEYHKVPVPLALLMDAQVPGRHLLFSHQCLDWLLPLPFRDLRTRTIRALHGIFRRICPTLRWRQPLRTKTNTYRTNCLRLSKPNETKYPDEMSLETAFVKRHGNKCLTKL